MRGRWVFGLAKGEETPHSFGPAFLNHQQVSPAVIAMDRAIRLVGALIHMQDVEYSRAVHGKRSYPLRYIDAAPRDIRSPEMRVDATDGFIQSVERHLLLLR